MDNIERRRYNRAGTNTRRLVEAKSEAADTMDIHIDSARLRQVVTDKRDFKMDELQHLLICGECLDALAKLRSENRKTKAKGAKEPS
jgi:hypothetical protein